MARKKVNLQWISNTLVRRATFKRRCKGLMKKASELTTLCGAKACVVVYGEGKVQPEVWPSVEEARQLLTKYRNMPELPNLKKVENQKDFLSSRLAKLRAQVSKSESENYEREALYVLHERMNRRRFLFDASTKELTKLQKIVQERNIKAKERLQQLCAAQGAPMEPQVQPLPRSSSSQPQDPPYPGTEMPVLAQAAEEQQPQQQEWPVDRAPNGGEVGTLPLSALLGSNNGSASPSSSGGNMVQPYSPGSYSGLPWIGEWDSFPPKE